jgi:hypothetical protein
MVTVRLAQDQVEGIVAAILASSGDEPDKLLRDWNAFYDKMVKDDGKWQQAYKELLGEAEATIDLGEFLQPLIGQLLKQIPGVGPVTDITDALTNPGG